MEKIILIICIALVGCNISENKQNYYKIKKFTSANDGRCIYFVEFTDKNDTFSFLDSCGKFNPGDGVRLVKTIKQ